MPPPGALVRLHGAGGTTLGVRIAPARAVALAASVGPSQLLRVEDANGGQAFALVAQANAGTGLVAVDLPTERAPAELAHPAAGPARALVLEAGAVASHPGRLVAAPGGELAWRSDAPVAAPAGSPVVDAAGAVVGVLAFPPGRMLKAATLSAFAPATR
jgi:hypothetical protein